MFFRHMEKISDQIFKLCSLLLENRLTLNPAHLLLVFFSKIKSLIYSISQENILLSIFVVFSHLSMTNSDKESE